MILAPSLEQRRDPGWARDAAEIAASRLSPRGIAYVIPSGAALLRRELEVSGLQETAALLHVPNVPDGRYIAPVGTQAERYVLSGSLATSRLKRLVAIGLGVRGRTRFGPTGIVYRRSPAAPLAEWTFTLGGTPRPPGSVLMTTGASRGAVLHRFVGTEPEPDAIVKLSQRASIEAAALREIAPSAGRAGARVPSILYSGEHATTPLLLQSVVTGRNAAILVAHGRVAVADLQSRIASWLERWARLTVRSRELIQEDLDRFVLSRAVALLLQSDVYLEHLERLCARAVGVRCPFVATHGDLTTANVILDEQAEPGIVDWEEASEDSLPLMDFYYAIADIAAARTSYRDRASAVADCFAADGEGAGFVSALRRSVAGAIDAGEVVQELGFHACWLHHATNEAARAPLGAARPFAAILAQIASDPSRFALTSR